jgi:hypothetical protein
VVVVVVVVVAAAAAAAVAAVAEFVFHVTFILKSKSYSSEKELLCFRSVHECIFISVLLCFP